MGRLGGPLAASLLFLVAAVPGRAQEACTLTQITNTIGSNTFNVNPAINANGSRIAFESNADLVGTNGDGISWRRAGAQNL